MLAEHIDTKFFASLCKSPERIQGQNISEYSTPSVIIDFFKKPMGYFGRRLNRKIAVFGFTIIVIYLRVLMR
jgi:hypothetical protein